MKRPIFLVFLFVFVLCLPFAAQASDDERQVVVTGVGMNEEEAKRQAYRNAVQSVVGALVVAETLVENNELVRDKILSHSDGYVTKVEQMGQSVALPGGLVEVTMKVTVKSRQLREKLQAENISVIAMDGGSLFARAATQNEQKRDATAIVADFLKGANLPASLISSAANIDQAEVTESGGTATVKVPITVSVNMDAYRKFVGDLKKTLTDLGFKGETVSLEAQSASSTTGGKPIIAYLSGGSSAAKLWAGNEPIYIIAICEMYSLESKQSRFTFFNVPRSVLETFEGFPEYVEIRTELLDGGQSQITEQNVRLTMSPYSSYNDQFKRDILGLYLGNNRGIVVISPGVRKNATYMPYASSTQMPIACADHNPATIHATFVLSNDELQAAKSIRTNAVNGEPPAKQ